MGGSYGSPFRLGSCFSAFGLAYFQLSIPGTISKLFRTLLVSSEIDQLALPEANRNSGALHTAERKVDQAHLGKSCSSGVTGTGVVLANRPLPQDRKHGCWQLQSLLIRSCSHLTCTGLSGPRLKTQGPA